MRLLFFLIVAVVYLHVYITIFDTLSIWYKNCMASLGISYLVKNGENSNPVQYIHSYAS